MIDFSTENLTGTVSSTDSSIAISTNDSFKTEKNINDRMVPDSDSKNSNKTNKNNNVMIGLVIAGIIFTIGIILTVKIYLDGRCMRMRSSRRLLSSKGYRYNGAYSMR